MSASILGQKKTARRRLDSLTALMAVSLMEPTDLLSSLRLGHDDAIATAHKAVCEVQSLVAATVLRAGNSRTFVGEKFHDTSELFVCLLQRIPIDVDTFVQPQSRIDWRRRSGALLVGALRQGPLYKRRSQPGKALRSRARLETAPVSTRLSTSRSRSGRHSTMQSPL
jgi:hypothetical protein